MFDPLLIFVLLSFCKLRRPFPVSCETIISALVLSSCRSWNTYCNDAMVFVPSFRELLIKWNLQNYQKRLR